MEGHTNYQCDLFAFCKLEPSEDTTYSRKIKQDENVVQINRENILLCRNSIQNPIQKVKSIFSFRLNSISPKHKIAQNTVNLFSGSEKEKVKLNNSKHFDKVSPSNISHQKSRFCSENTLNLIMEQQRLRNFQNNSKIDRIQNLKQKQLKIYRPTITYEKFIDKKSQHKPIFLHNRMKTVAQQDQNDSKISQRHSPRIVRFQNSPNKKIDYPNSLTNSRVPKQSFLSCSRTIKSPMKITYNAQNCVKTQGNSISCSQTNCNQSVLSNFKESNEFKCNGNSNVLTFAGEKNEKQSSKKSSKIVSVTFCKNNMKDCASEEQLKGIEYKCLLSTKSIKNSLVIPDQHYSNDITFTRNESKLKTESLIDFLFEEPIQQNQILEANQIPLAAQFVYLKSQKLTDNNYYYQNGNDRKDSKVIVLQIKKYEQNQQSIGKQQFQNKGQLIKFQKQIQNSVNSKLKSMEENTLQMVGPKEAVVIQKKDFFEHLNREKFYPRKLFKKKTIQSILSIPSECSFVDHQFMHKVKNKRDFSRWVNQMSKNQIQMNLI